jgi:RNA polymerase sigma-70 factor (ECF subfamily)
LPAEKPEVSRLFHLYVERSNRRDWDGIRELITADARLRVAERFEGPLADPPYFGRYERLAMPWRMAVDKVEGRRAVVVLRQDNGRWVPYGIVRAELINNSITRVVDYSHCPWVLPAADSLIIQLS